MAFTQMLVKDSGTGFQAILSNRVVVIYYMFLPTWKMSIIEETYKKRNILTEKTEASINLDRKEGSC